MKLTDARRQAFLQHLAEHGVAREAARAASPHATGGDGAYKTFADERQRNPEFARLWDEAVADAIGKLEREAHRRGVQGWVERGVFDKDGNRVGDVVRFSDRMLELSLKRHMPEYRDRSQFDVNVAADVRTRLEAELVARTERQSIELFTQLSSAERETLRSLLEKAQQLQQRAQARMSATIPDETDRTER